MTSIATKKEKLINSNNYIKFKLNSFSFIILLATSALSSSTNLYMSYLLFAESIGLGVIIAAIILYVLLWLLTDEIMNREELFFIVNLIFSLIWWIFTQPIGGALNVLFNTALKTVGVVLVAAFFGLSLVSLLLLVIPLLSFFRKYLKFNALGKRLMRVEGDYNYLAGNAEQNIKGRYDQIQDIISNLKSAMKEIKTKVDTAFELRNTALKNPNIIINSLVDKPVIPKAIKPSLNYLIIGLGGTGSALLESFIDYLNTQNMIDPNATNNPYLFVFFDTSSANINAIKKKYEGKPVEKLIYVFDNFNALLKDNLIAHNPWMAGMDVNLVDGTGNRRALGMAAYITVKDMLIKEISSRVNDLIIQTKNPRFMVIVLNSLGGGTGSGSFLSFTRDIANSLRNMNVEPYILGFGVLPKSEEGTIFHANAYGALKELQFMLSKGREKVMETHNFKNPFLAYFLISRDRISSTVDEEIALALTRFIFDLGTAGYVQGTGTEVAVAGKQGYDPQDIGYRASLAPKYFFTFSRYDVYFPASRLSWFVNVAIPLNSEIDASYQKLSSQVAEDLNMAISEYVQKVEKLLNDAETLDNEYREFMPNVYKRWNEVAKASRDKLAKIKESLAENGPYSPINLKKEYDLMTSPVAGPEESIVSLNKQVISVFKDTINAEREFLKSTPARGIEYVFNVPDPEKFNTDILKRETSSVYSIMKSLGRIDDFKTALNTLSTTVGSIEQTMANVDYSRIYVPLYYSSVVKSFIERHNKNLISREGNNVVSPSIITIVMLVTSASENLNVPEFPSEQAIRNALESKTPNPDFKKASIDMKKFEISSYQIITGFYPYKLRKNEPPLLKDLSYLEKSYNDFKSKTQDMMFHHTLFYDDYGTFDDVLGRLIGKRVSSLVPSEAVKIIAKFWQEYDPASEFLDMWGILELAEAYNEVYSVKNELESFIEWMGKAVTTLERGSTEVDPNYLKNILVSGINLEKLKVIKEIYQTNQFINNEEIKNAIDEVINEASSIFNYLQNIKLQFDSWFERLSAIKEKKQGDPIFMIKIMQPMINELTKLEERTHSLEDQLKDVLNIISL